MLFAPDEWGRFQAKFDNVRPKQRNVQIFETFIIGGSADLSIDRQWRVRLPRAFRLFLNNGPSAQVLLCRPDPTWISEIP
jgi:DNA-binding transcriptional regulator/RsmH inhibitor MraZ